MGRHDELGHKLHISKKARFNAPAPKTAPLERQISAPQEPQPGSNAKNQYR